MLYKLFSPLSNCFFFNLLAVPQRQSKNILYRRQQLGFTLVEIMIALILLAGLTVIALPRIGSHTNELKATIRKLTVLGKQLQVHSRLEHKTYRLAFHLHEKEEHSFWVESASGYVSESADEEEDNNNDDEEGKQSLNTFQLDASILKEPISLPKPLLFRDIEVEDEISKNGKAYIHFFPQGVIEEAAIHISNGKAGNKLGWTITYNSLTGKGHVIGKYIPLRNLRDRR